MSILVDENTRVITQGIPGSTALAGTIISVGKGDAASKREFLRECGVSVADSPAEMAEALLKIWKL